MVPAGYVFHQMSATDLPMIRRWLATPQVARWWGDPDEQFALVSEDLDHPSMDQFVVATDSRPFAYLQCYDPAAWPDTVFAAYREGTRGIDQFIGEPDMMDRGHGSALVRNFVDELLKMGTPAVVTDPDPANLRAVRAYEKAGFQKVRLVATPDGRTLLMVRNA
jgi:aminoglycoside 6'-N-acetyltransferase